jgi:hypothetical protein
MACGADRIADYAISETFPDVHTIISVSSSVTLRVVCLHVIDATSACMHPGQQARPQQWRLLPQRRLALPLAAVSLALAAAPLLRRLPGRLPLMSGAARKPPVLPGTPERAAHIRRPTQPQRLDAGRPVLRAVPVALPEVADAPPAVERELVAPTGLPF